MPLKLMYITNRPEVAQIVEAAGVDRVFVDMEHIGKALRQDGMDTVQSHHTVEDIRRVRPVLKQAELLVRCNPIHDGSEAEIEAIVSAGADIIMLPYFKTMTEVERFLSLVGGRAKTMLLVETPEAAQKLEAILSLDGIDEVHIGLNDLSLGLGKKFMFELLTDGTVERLCLICKQKGVPCGFGGIAALGKGMLPAECIIREHYRLGSTGAIVSRSFCNTDLVTDLDEIREIFETGITAIRDLEAECERYMAYFRENEQETRRRVAMIAAQIEKNLPC